MANEKPVARCLDISRLISRVGRDVMTGVDRVELAYLRFFANHQDQIFGLARVVQGYVLLDRDGLKNVLHRIEGKSRWGRIDLIGAFSRKYLPLRRRAEADLRRWAVARCDRVGLVETLVAYLPKGCTYLNVGHSNLGPDVLASAKQVGRTVILVHDMIPLDFPDYQREQTVAAFESRMRGAMAVADHVICISAETERRVHHWTEAWFRRANTSVAHIGVEVPELGPAPDIASPYFITLGTIEPRKNHALLLDLWETFQKQPDAPKLVIVGARGWRNEDVFARLDAKPPHVIELNNLSDDALGGLLANSAGLLMPSHAEGFGLPPAEALALNVPVICSDLPVFREILGNSPIYAESGDLYQWKQSVLHLAGNVEAIRKEMAGRSFHAPTWEDHFNHVLSVA